MRVFNNSREKEEWNGVMAVFPQRHKSVDDGQTGELTGKEMGLD